ncbi:MAG TPA: serine/threonine-protein kinase [Vicinamibacterales bacterium]|jgi:hypothetical protein|nr:serine/threonine-protein kinase [Vicinamibacterales bacterium]
MTFPPGTRVGPYEVTSVLGTGGMGEVLRARDSRLNRDVAIKVLLPEVARDPDRLARFSREASVLASLNHPNIAHVHGLEHADSTPALVMELVEGPTLADRIANGPIPMVEALSIARQIADALEAAHEQGIVHRDLKPANIKVRSDGTVKVLDFGLAKAIESGSAAARADLMNSPTLSVHATAAGLILGTAAYMSPEQARNGDVDKRTDLWAFGAVLYEMVTGRRLFDGPTISDTIAAVLTKDPDWGSLPDDTPSSIRRLLRRCLQKNRKTRLADAADARLELEDALDGATDAAAAGNGKRTIPWILSRVALPAIAGTALFTGAAFWLAGRATASTTAPLVLTIVPPADIALRPVGTMNAPPHLSPDGRSVLFVGSHHLYIRRLDSLDLLEVPGVEGLANEPFWHGSSAVTVPVVSGAARQLLDIKLPDGPAAIVMKYSANVRGGGWSQTEGVLLGATPPIAAGAGGDGHGLNVVGRGPASFLYPEFIPGTNDFIAWSDTGGGDGAVVLATMADGAITNVTPLFKNETAARYTAAGGGQLLYVKNDNLYAQRLNAAARAMTGEPRLVVRGVSSQPALARADFSVAENGTIAWRPGTAALAEVTAFDRNGAAVGTAGPPGALDSIFLSPSEEGRLLACSDSVAWIANAGDPGRASLPSDVQWQLWLPDGRAAGIRGRDLVARKDDSGTIETIGKLADGIEAVWALSADGRTVLGRIGSRIAWAPVADMSSRAAWKPLADSDEVHSDGSFSRDGHFVLYDADTGIYVEPFPGPGRRQRVAPAGAIDPVWRGDGNEIAFVQSGAVWTVAVTMRGNTITFGPPQKLFEGARRAPASVFQSRSLAESSDGSRFYLLQSVQQPALNMIHVLVTPTDARLIVPSTKSEGGS